MSESRSTGRRAPIVPGMVLILLGIWLLGREIGFSPFIGEVLWPWLIVLLGVVIWARYIFFPPRNADDVFWGTGAILAGAFLVSWYNGLFLSELEGWGDLWPVIPLILGISALVQWVFSIRNWGTLVFGLGAGGVGAVGLAWTLGRITSAQALQIANLWPILVIVAGLGLLLQALLGRRSQF